MRKRPFALAIALFFWFLASTGRAASIDSQSRALAHYIMAACYDLDGQTTDAIREYQRSVKYDSQQAAPHVKLGAYYLRLEDMKKAAAQLKLVTRLDPENTQAHYLLALVDSSQHKYDEAAAEYEIILKAAAKDDPAGSDAHMYLGQLYYSEQKYPSAIQEFSKVVKLDPANSNALYLLGSVYLDSKDTERAIGIFRQVLRMDPQNSEALNSLGYVYAEEGIHLMDAVRMIHRAIEIDPANGAYQDSLGWALYKQGHYMEGLMVLQKAQKYIQDEVLYDHIGDVYKAMKDYVRACEYWRKSLDLDPHQSLVQEKIKQWEKTTASRSFHRLN